MNLDTSFNKFAESYDKNTGDDGDYMQQHTVNPSLFDLIGNPSGKVIYDIACGNGYISRKLVNNGAKEIWASDFSKDLIEIAQKKYQTRHIRYLVQDAIEFDGMKKAYFDLVLMNLAISYIKDVDILLQGITKILKPKGRFIFSIDHPLKYVAHKSYGRDDDDIIKESEKYLDERFVRVYNLWTKKRDLNIFFRPLHYYINKCGANNLLITRLKEPKTKLKYKDRIAVSNIPLKMIIETVKIS